MRAYWERNWLHKCEWGIKEPQGIMQESWSRDKKDVITHRVKKIIDNWPGHVIWGYDKQMSQLSPTYKDLVDNFSVPSRIGVANQKRIEKESIMGSLHQ